MEKKTTRTFHYELSLKWLEQKTHSLSHHPQTSRPGHRAMACVHPAVPWQQALKDIPHNHDYGHPQASAHQNSSNYLLAVCGHISAVDRERERYKGGETKRKTQRGSILQQKIKSFNCTMDKYEDYFLPLEYRVGLCEKCNVIVVNEYSGYKRIMRWYGIQCKYTGHFVFKLDQFRNLKKQWATKTQYKHLTINVI